MFTHNKEYDKDLLLCVFLFLLLLAIYLVTGDPKVETIMQNFGGAVMMALKVGLGVQFLPNQTTINQPTTALVTNPVAEIEEKKE